MANPTKELRASAWIANGTWGPLQNDRFQRTGRWRAGPLGLDLSKAGVSGSMKDLAGRSTFLRPRFSSLKIAGVKLRHEKATTVQRFDTLQSGALSAVELVLRPAVVAVLLAIFLILCLHDLLADVLDRARSS